MRIAALDTWRGSDKFPTEGGVQYTTGKAAVLILAGLGGLVSTL
ncbi:MAG: hypothetical protein NT167_13020 [Verrucomicrobia bacterium]|nr:hypothetical protein [Verrucomicrobiota bacterium]